MSVSSKSLSRRHDLDWLRAIAFILLIFYHVGMFYVTWGWHVKSTYVTPVPELFMMMLNPWRLALLWIVSGVAVRFMADRLGTLGFAGNRLWRLFPPILAGMLLVVPPQTWFELQQMGLAPDSFGEFYGNYISQTQSYPMITPTWNHLWYVVYLLVYCIILALFRPLLKPVTQAFENAIAFLSGLKSSLGLLLIFPLPFLLYRFTVEDAYPVTHALVDDWGNHAKYFTIFLIGYFIAKNDRFWRAIADNLPRLAIGVPIVALVLAIAWYGPVWEQVSKSPVLPLFQVLRVIYAWWMICLVLGLAQKYLNQPSALLGWMTSSVFCWYILHQTITVSAGFYLSKLSLGGPLEFLLLTLITFGGAVLGAEIIRHIPIVRIFFGFPGALRPISAANPIAKAELVP